MKINNKILNILVILGLFLTNYHILAMEFKTEQEKSIWIKNFFKDKEFEPMSYFIRKTTLEEQKFRRKLIYDFINQNGFEHIEPIARGTSLSDPEIAKYNKACPDKKPIDMYKWWSDADYRKGFKVTEEELEDEDNRFIDIFRCHGNMKIYRFNLYNTSDAKQEYILYCDNHRAIQHDGELFDINREIDDFVTKGAYIHLDPEKCLYSHNLLDTHPFWGDAVTGIVKYQENYYFYTIEHRANGALNILLMCKDGVSNHKFYETYIKEIIK
ncbi:MAG: hypothetical protein LN563_00960 [Rickettsia endosymbiont of Platyusa sonomae]|nr:hypothetical protein [Rickettsia endosymbiont of Platyusa sonomae]